ncbi:sigma-70 family RNA polymerase sigma factor [bacterium]|nr:sigma-70 family RNA polymerase sigma factor [bacterium]
MFLQLSGVGDQKITYKDHSTIEFESLSTYILLAKKAISKFANNMYSGLSVKMLKDEEAISSVANAIMMADWRWDDNYQNTQNTKKTRYSYRNQCAIWAIQTYITKTYKHQKKIHKKVFSLDFDNKKDDDSGSIYEKIENLTSEQPDLILMEQEEKDNLHSSLQCLLSSNLLSDRQKDYIKLYYFENQTFEQIGQKYNITREAVRQGLNKALDLIRGLIS